MKLTVRREVVEKSIEQLPDLLVERLAHAEREELHGELAELVTQAYDLGTRLMGLACDYAYAGEDFLGRRRAAVDALVQRAAHIGSDLLEYYVSLGVISEAALVADSGAE